MKLEDVRYEVAERMEEIKTFFKTPAKITVIVRRPGLPDQDFMMTDDEPCELRALIDRREFAGKDQPKS